MTSLFLDPTGHSEQAGYSLAPRDLTSLDGSRVALLVNGKRNSDVLLAGIGDLLSQRYQMRSLETLKKPSSTRVSPPALIDQLARDFDVVITAIGD